MAEWLHEDGIGEARAALVEDGRMLEMLVEPEGAGPRAGAILAARLVARADARGRGRVALATGGEALLKPVPPALTEGAELLVELVREALPEAGGWKPPQARPAADGAVVAAGPDLLARLRASRHSVRSPASAEGVLEALGWSEALEEAALGRVARAEALLRISLTPAMTLIDVDGAAAAAPLAVAGAGLAGRIIRRFGFAGPIGIDLPTLADRAQRQAAAAALDAALPPPFERTAVNGFGFLMLVRPRVRPSLPELLAADPTAAAARALLARAERARGHGPLTLTAAAAVIDHLAAHPRWLETLARRAGAPVALRPAAGLAISAGHAQRDRP